MNISFETDKNLIKEGAIKLLSICLALSRGDVLALFSDETVEETSGFILEAAHNLGLTVKERRVSLEEQRQFKDGEELSVEDKNAMDSARAIITCLSDHFEGTSYRKELLREGTTMGKRFGHMPGAIPDLLPYAATINYENAASRCDNLALALALGNEVRLQSYILKENGDRQTFNLDFEVGGLTRYPITSNGIIELGTWGNVPGGETFIAPIEDTATGTFVLNGSFKGHVINPPDYLLLHFENGKMGDREVEGTPHLVESFRPFLDFARQRGDKYYDSLAELGIGVNTSIKELTGKALFDEKCYGTAHIAIGDNKRYGGKHQSDIHEDLITRSPTLWVDNKLILKDGRDFFNPQEWRESLATYQGRNEVFTNVTRTAINAVRTRSNRLQVKKHVTSGRICSYTIGDDATSKILAEVFSVLPIAPGRQIPLKDILATVGKRLKLTPEDIRKALSIMKKHNLITFS